MALLLLIDFVAAKQYRYCTWEQHRQFTISLFVLKESAALLISMTHFLHVTRELRSMVSVPVSQTNYIEFQYS